MEVEVAGAATSTYSTVLGGIPPRVGSNRLLPMLALKWKPSTEVWDMLSPQYRGLELHQHKDHV